MARARTTAHLDANERGAKFLPTRRFGRVVSTRMDYARAISRRALITLIAVVAALAAAAIAAAVAFVGRAPSEPAGREGKPPLALDASLTEDGARSSAEGG